MKIIRHSNTKISFVDNSNKILIEIEKTQIHDKNFIIMFSLDCPIEMTIKLEKNIELLCKRIDTISAFEEHQSGGIMFSFNRHIDELINIIWGSIHDKETT